MEILGPNGFTAGELSGVPRPAFPQRHGRADGRGRGGGVPGDGQNGLGALARSGKIVKFISLQKRTTSFWEIHGEVPRFQGNKKHEKHEDPKMEE